MGMPHTWIDALPGCQIPQAQLGSDIADQQYPDHEVPRRLHEEQPQADPDDSAREGDLRAGRRFEQAGIARLNLEEHVGDEQRQHPPKVVPSTAFVDSSSFTATIAK